MLAILKLFLIYAFVPGTVSTPLPVEDRFRLLEHSLLQYYTWIGNLQDHNQALHRLLGETRKELAALRATVRFAPTYRQASFEQQYWSEDWGPVWAPSGGGSDAASTSEVRKRLEAVFVRFSVETILDVPCGDLRWILPLLMKRPYMNYTGVDVVRPLIQSNQRRFAHNSRWRFLVGDLIAGQLPKDTVDLAISRDLIQHLMTVEDVKQALLSLKRVAKLVLLSSQNHSSITNADMTPRGEDVTVVGGYTTIVGYNLRAPPFSLPQPLEIIPDGLSRFLLLYRAEDIPDMPVDLIPNYVFGDIRTWEQCDGWADFGRFAELAAEKVLVVLAAHQHQEANWSGWIAHSIHHPSPSKELSPRRAHSIGIAAVAVILWASGQGQVDEQLPANPLGMAVKTLRDALWHAGLRRMTEYLLVEAMLFRATLNIHRDVDRVSADWPRIAKLAELAKAIGFDSWESVCFPHYFKH